MSDTVLRRVFLVSVFYNIGGALLFVAPASALGQFVQMPIPVSPVYNLLFAYAVLLFAGLYVWIVRQPEVPRAIVSFAAIGKAGAFALFVGFWILGLVSPRAVIAGVGDVLFACLFTVWLLTNPATAAVAA